jgi:hypothetical protein
MSRNLKHLRGCFENLGPELKASVSYSVSGEDRGLAGIRSQDEGTILSIHGGGTDIGKREANSVGCNLRKDGILSLAQLRFP